METKDRTQASYTLVDINEQTRIAFEKCKETKEQKIERLKHQIRINNQGRKAMKHSSYAMKLRDYNKEIRQQIKELENDTRN